MLRGDLVVAIWFRFLNNPRAKVSLIVSANFRPNFFSYLSNRSCFEKKLTTFSISLYNGITAFIVVVGDFNGVAN